MMNIIRQSCKKDDRLKAVRPFDFAILLFYIRSDIEASVARPARFIHRRYFDKHLCFLARLQPFNPDLFDIASGVNEPRFAKQLIRKECRLPRAFIVCDFDRIQLGADKNVIIGGTCQIYGGISVFKQRLATDLHLADIRNLI